MQKMRKKLKLFPSTFKDATLRWFMGFIALAQMHKPSIKSIETIVGQKTPRKKSSE